MGKPSAELLPACTEPVPFLRGEQHTLLRVADKHVLELLCHLLVDDKGIHLVIKAQASGIEIGAANGTEPSINHHDLGVMEAWLV